MRVTIKVLVYLILTTVTVYCANELINRMASHFRISTSLLQKQDRDLVKKPSDSSAIHKMIEEIRVGTTETPLTVLSQDVSDVNEVNEFPSQESQHVTYSTNRLLEQQPVQESEGYILPFSVNEEQTNGAKNLWQLQIWANLVKMHVVEPFAQDSAFKVNGIAPNFSEALRFGDYFDLEKWNTMVVKTQGSPLVKWEEFITKAPRDAILLYMTRG